MSGLRSPITTYKILDSAADRRVCGHLFLSGTLIDFLIRFISGETGQAPAGMPAVGALVQTTDTIMTCIGQAHARWQCSYCSSGILVPLLVGKPEAVPMNAL